ncbi:MAG: hypothetical protein IPJ00_11740 [Saprospirales bacterium]|nr:hypothetical protein [Saprospirales bacterium]
MPEHPVSQGIERHAHSKGPSAKGDKDPLGVLQSGVKNNARVGFKGQKAEQPDGEQDPAPHVDKVVVDAFPFEIEAEQVSRQDRK